MENNRLHKVIEGYQQKLTELDSESAQRIHESDETAKKLAKSNLELEKRLSELSKERDDVALFQSTTVEKLKAKVRFVLVVFARSFFSDACYIGP